MNAEIPFIVLFLVCLMQCHTNTLLVFSVTHLLYVNGARSVY